MNISAVSWYLDWTFWTMAVALIALLLSQLPPLHTLLKRSRLELDAFDSILITHTIGNPNANLYVAVSNIGGRNVKIKSIKLTFKHGEETFTLPAKTFQLSLSDVNNVILPPFRLKPGETWEHLTSFYKNFSREDEKKFRQLSANNKADILQKRAVMPQDTQVLVESDKANVTPLIDFFKDRFKWKPGEYEIVLTVESEPATATVSKRFRITLFESDSLQLQSYTDGYKWGMGVYWYDYEKQPSIHVPLITA